MKNQENLEKKSVFAKLCQFIYLSVSNFQKNNLWENASACSFGFIFSFIPITLIILTVLVNFLRVSPNVLNYVMSFADEIKPIVDINPVINNILKVNSIKFMDIFLAAWVIWMARKMFLSIVRAIEKIFRPIVQRKSMFSQVLTFISEFVLILIFIAITIVTFILNQILELSIFEFIINSFPKILRQSSNIVVNSFLYSMLFLYTLYAYKVISRTKPKFRKCIFYAALNTAAFYVFSFFINKFLNVTNYNIIYGTISTLVVLMMKVYFFFIIFLFCGQMVYVSQFFDQLLIAEIYLLPSQKKTMTIKFLEKINFFNPTVINLDFETKIYQAGDTIYSQNDEVQNIFYLKQGSVSEYVDEGNINYNTGSFFGEISCVINQPQNGTAIATTDCKVIVISAESFKNLAQQNPLVSAYAVEKLNKFTNSLQK